MGHLLFTLALPHVREITELHDHVVGRLDHFRLLPPRRQVIHDGAAGHGLSNVRQAPVDPLVDKQRPIVTLVCVPLALQISGDAV